MDLAGYLHPLRLLLDPRLHLLPPSDSRDPRHPRLGSHLHHMAHALPGSSPPDVGPMGKLPLEESGCAEQPGHARVTHTAPTLCLCNHNADTGLPGRLGHHGLRRPGQGARKSNDAILVRELKYTDFVIFI